MTHHGCHRARVHSVTLSFRPGPVIWNDRNATRCVQNKRQHHSVAFLRQVTDFSCKKGAIIGCPPHTPRSRGLLTKSFLTQMFHSIKMLCCGGWFQCCLWLFLDFFSDAHTCWLNPLSTKPRSSGDRFSQLDSGPWLFSQGHLHYAVLLPYGRLRSRC